MSDKLLTIQSAFLDKLQHGDCVMANRGFPLEEEMAARGAVRIFLFLQEERNSCLQRK